MLVLGFFLVAARIIDGQSNVALNLHGDPPSVTLPEIDSKVAEFHDSLFIADWHADNLLWDRNPLTKIDHGHVDIPRLIEGNIALQVFSTVIKTPRGQNYTSNTGDTDNITILAMANRWPVKSWFSLCERAIYQSEKLHRAQRDSEGRLMIVKSKSDLKSLLDQRTEKKSVTGGLLAIEGLHALEGKIENVQGLYDHGFRVMGLTHFFDNEVGGSSAGLVQGGLTRFGSQVITKMNALNIIIDVAHASPKLMEDVLRQSARPIIVSHTGVKGTYDSPRNLSDDQIRAIAGKGGLIGVGFWDGAVGDPRPASIVKAMNHIRRLVGVEYISLGSDWDGGTTTYFDSANIAVLTRELLRSGFSHEEVRMIMGENQLNFLLKYLPD